MSSWRTRDIQGDQFRQSKSSSRPEAGPPRDKIGAERYGRHLPFQVFCCESGTHVVDPMQSYYQGINYHSGSGYANLSTTESAPRRDSDSPCLDSSQAHFCRDLWINGAREGVREVEKDLRSSPGIGVRAAQPGAHKRALEPEKRAEEGHAQRQRPWC